MRILYVDKNMTVALRYKMCSSKGDVLENTMQSSPVNYLHGSNGILILLQEQLHGLKAGDKKKVFLLKQSSEADDDFVFDVVIDDVREASPEEIMLGYPLSITTEKCDDDCYCYDEIKNLKMQIHLISGFLGSGKTTAIQTACKTLQSNNKKVGVITNDQGIKLVDTGYFESNEIPNRQVINGCFCCNYNSIDENIQSLIEANNPAVIFAESVGSCTDIVATVMKPLLQFKKDVAVTVSTFADVRLLHMLFIENKPLFKDEINYIYKKQLEEAQHIIVSKIDLITKEELNAVQQFLQKEYADKSIIYINGTNDKSIMQWLGVINKSAENNKLSSLSIDYEIYGAGEAMLAWLDTELRIYSSNNNAKAIALKLTQTIYKNIQLENLSIGHLKFLIDDNIKISYTATSNEQVTEQLQEASSALVLVNARIQTTPEFLSELIDKTIQQTETENECKIIKESFAAFKPGFPKPAYRIAE